MLQLSDFVRTLRSSAWVVFNNFLLIDATDRNKISSDQKRLFFAYNVEDIVVFLGLKVFNSNNSYTSLFFRETTINKYSFFNIINIDI